MLVWSNLDSPDVPQNLPAGLQPPRLGALQRQVDRYWAAVQDCCTDLDKYQVGGSRQSQALADAPLRCLPVCSDSSSTSTIGCLTSQWGR